VQAGSWPARVQMRSLMFLKLTEFNQYLNSNEYQKQGEQMLLATRARSERNVDNRPQSEI
jgi:hypothetical protein